MIQAGVGRQSMTVVASLVRRQQRGLAVAGPGDVEEE